MSTCLCDSLLLLLLLLFLLIIKLSELHQANLGQPRVLTLALQGSRSRPRFVRVEVGRCQRKQPKGRHDREEAAPAKPVLDCPAHESGDQVVDDVAAEEEGVDE